MKSNESTPEGVEPTNEGWLELRVIRTRDGWGLPELAKASGVSHEALRLYELGRRRPRPRTIRKIADALKVPYSVLEPSPRDRDESNPVSGDAA